MAPTRYEDVSGGDYSKILTERVTSSFLIKIKEIGLDEFYVKVGKIFFKLTMQEKYKELLSWSLLHLDI